MTFLSELKAALGPDARLIVDPDIAASYSHDQASFAKYETPTAVLLAASVEEISQTVRLANQYKVPVVTRGAGSGLAGGANASRDSIVISLERMNRILELDPDNRIARVEAGVINLDLDTAAKEFGLAYLPDPSSRDWSTIGGNCATNAGGMCCVKYGVTSQHVRAMKIVLADGEVIEVGKKTKKEVASLDLKRLFIGSEGTLGIIVEITVGLEVRRTALGTMLAMFPNIKQAGAAVVALSRFRPSMLEIMDQTTLKSIEQWHPLGFEVAGAIVIMQLDEGLERGDAALEVCQQFELIDGLYSLDPQTSIDLIRVRRLALHAAERLGAAWVEDVTVPITKIPELCERIEALARELNLLIPIVGHAGDGNMHPVIVHDHGDEAGAARAAIAFQRIVGIAQQLGGTATGEHGVGSTKTGFVQDENSPRLIEIQRGIKRLLDPNGILNPGKKIP